MNAELLIDVFSRLGDDPETVQRFRKIIVGLAMSGRLDSPTEPVLTTPSLLDQLETGKCISVQQGSLRKQKPPKIFSFEELPAAFSLSSNFVRLGDVARIEKGQTSITKADPGPYPLVVTAEERRTCDHFDFDGSAAIVPLVSSAGHGKASLQRLHYQEGKFALGSILAAIFPNEPKSLSARFLFEYLTAFKDELLVSRMIGTANVSLSVSKIFEVPVPLVPPFVQRKVDELMGLCDRLETAQADRETVRDRLAATSFTRLNAPETAAATSPAPEINRGFSHHTRFVLSNLPALTARPDQIKVVRQTILSLAVRGKLVPQNASDEPALKLLERLKRAQTAAYNREGLRSRPPIENINRADMWFDFPSSWELTSFDDVFVIAGGVAKGQKIAGDDAIEMPYLRVANVQRGCLDLSIIKNITIRAADKQRYELRQGDILMTEGGDWDKLGRAAIWNEEIENCIYQNHVFRVRPPSSDISPVWVIVYANSLLGRSYFENASKQTTNLASINMTQLRGCPLPLPPLAEQHRIVAKVDALMALCDRLEASLTAATDTRRRLLNALLAEALAPDEDRLLEAAE